MKTKLLVPVLIFFNIVLAYSQDCKPSLPTVSYTNQVTYDAVNKIYRFYYNGSDESFYYEYKIGLDNTQYDNGGSFNGLKVCTRSTFWPSVFGCLSVKLGNDEYHGYDPGVKFLSLSTPFLNGNTLITQWRMRKDYVFHVNYKMTFTISGRTLVINVEELGPLVGFAIDGAYAFPNKFHLDRCEAPVSAQRADVIGVPYLINSNILLMDSRFTSMFFDWSKTNASVINTYYGAYFSNSSKYFSSWCDYNRKTDGMRNPMNETIYLTVSNEISNTFPSIPNPVSPNKTLSSNKIIFDYWKPFNLAVQDINDVYNSPYNLRDLWVLIHYWQKNGYDTKLPEQYPPNPNFGGSATMTQVKNACLSKNYLIGLHENYTGVHDDTPLPYANSLYKSHNSPDLANIATNPYVVIWDPNFVDPNFPSYPLYGIKPMKFAEILQSHTMNIFANSSYLDYHTNMDQAQIVDYDYNYNYQGAGKFKASYDQICALGGILRNLKGGPVTAEGGKMLYYAGYFDDFCAEINDAKKPFSFDNSSKVGGFYRPLMVDFKLKKLNPKVFVHGLGWYERFFQNIKYGHCQGYTIDSTLMYVATTLAYGSGATFSTGSYGDHSDFKDLGLIMQKFVLPIQKQYANANVTDIKYNGPDGILRSASDYIRVFPNGYDDIDNDNFMSQVKVTYSNGVVVYVNRHKTRSWVISNPAPSGRSFYSHHSQQSGLDNPYFGSVNPSTVTLFPRNGWYYASDQYIQTPDNATLNQDQFALFDNYPNPFNSSTRIKFQIPQNEFVSIKIYDITGKEVLTVANSYFDKGIHEIYFNAEKLASGVYFYKFNSTSNHSIKKMTLIK
jgi:Secretion system C-terminal sorting domain